MISWLRRRLIRIAQIIVANGLRPEVAPLIVECRGDEFAGRAGAEWILRRCVDGGAADLLMLPAGTKLNADAHRSGLASYRWANWFSRDLVAFTEDGGLRMPLVSGVNSNNVAAPFFVGENIELMQGSVVSPDTRIGGNTYVGFNCHITKASIGRYVSIADNVAVGPGEHAVSRMSTSSVFYDEPYGLLTEGDCVIGDDVWIGNSCIIRRGVSIGVGAVIGANSFVNKDVPPFAIFAGSPARCIGYRFPEEVVNKIMKTEWWSLPVPEAKKRLAELELDIGGIR